MNYEDTFDFFLPLKNFFLSLLTGDLSKDVLLATFFCAKLSRLFVGLFFLFLDWESSCSTASTPDLSSFTELPFPSVLCFDFSFRFFNSDTCKHNQQLYKFIKPTSTYIQTLRASSKLKSTISLGFFSIS